MGFLLPFLVLLGCVGGPSPAAAPGASQPHPDAATGPVVETQEVAGTSPMAASARAPSAAPARPPEERGPCLCSDEPITPGTAGLRPCRQGEPTRSGRACHSLDRPD